MTRVKLSSITMFDTSVNVHVKTEDGEYAGTINLPFDDSSEAIVTWRERHGAFQKAPPQCVEYAERALAFSGLTGSVDGFPIEELDLTDGIVVCACVSACVSL